MSQISIEHVNYYQSEMQENQVCFWLSLFFEIKVTAFLIIRVFARWSTDNITYSRLLLSAVPEHLLPSQNVFIFTKNFLASWLHPKTFRCKPLRLRCFACYISVISNVNFHLQKWFVKWETVRASFPLSVCMIGVDNQTSQSELISLAIDFKFNSLFKISLDVDDDALFVPR